jgi:hypothetical protein
MRSAGAATVGAGDLATVRLWAQAARLAPGRDEGLCRGAKPFSRSREKVDARDAAG